jgi:hypothetical protein
MTPNVNPKAREEGLVTEELEDELLVYDLDRHKAHCLNSTAAVIWRRCDGKATVSEIATRLEKEMKVPVDDEVVWVALRRLGKANLLRERVTPSGELAFRSSRRDLMKKLALVGGLSIVTILSPTAAEAATGGPTGCKTAVSCVHVFNKAFENGQCCNGSKGICHITSDHNGTCGPETCTVC